MKIVISLCCFAVVAGLIGCTGEDQDIKGRPAAKTSKQANGVVMSKAEISAKADVPIYPGSDVPDGTSSVTVGDSETRFLMVMTTPDSVEKVSQYYRSKMPGLTMLKHSEDLLGTSPKGSLLHLTLSAKGGKTTINVSAIVPTSPSK